MNPDVLIDPPQFDVPEDFDEKPWKYVYLHLDADGNALYVGCTRTPLLRTIWHDQNSEWFGQVRDIVWYPSPAPYKVEAEIIRHLEPPHNIKGTMRDPVRRRAAERRRAAITTASDSRCLSERAS